jgi:hypothetical protein
VTAYLEDNRTSGWREQSTNITVAAQSYASGTLTLTLNASVEAIAVSLTGPSSLIIYANVVWVEGTWVDVQPRRSFYDADWEQVEDIVYAGPCFYGWDIVQKNVPSNYPTSSHWNRTFTRSFTGSESNITYNTTPVSGRFLVRQGQQYDWEGTINSASGYTATIQIEYPGGTASSGAVFTPTSDGPCDFVARIYKNTTSGATFTGSWSALRYAAREYARHNGWAGECEYAPCRLANIRVAVVARYAHGIPK